MEPKIARFFSKNRITEDEIKYIVRENKKTNIYLTDGRVIETYTPLKSILPSLKPDAFLNINKGVALNAARIAGIADGKYKMEDGREFKGRARMPSVYRREQERKYNDSQNEWTKEQVLNALTLFNGMPVGFCVLELIYRESDGYMNLVFRYCNKKLEEMVGLPQGYWVDRSVYELEQTPSAKWMISCASIAQDGGNRTMDMELNGCRTKVIVYQPYEGFCACMVLGFPE
jgi:PAS domain-containing protein